MRAVAIRVPLFIQYRTKFNTRRDLSKKPIHMERRILEAISQPIYPEALDDKTRTCSILKYRKEDALNTRKPIIKENKYEDFLIREAQKVLDASTAIIIFQQDWMILRRVVEIHNMFFPLGVIPIYFPYEVIWKTIADTKLRNLKPLINRQTMVVVGKLDSVKKLLAVASKIPDITLLGGFIDERIFTRQGLIDYAALPSIDGVRGELVSILGAPSQQTRSHLDFQQQHLTRLLDQYAVQLNESSNASSTRSTAH